MAPECLPLKNPEGLSRNRNSTERFYKYEKSMILIGFQQILLYDKTQPIGLGKINKHRPSIAWETLNFKTR